MKARRGFTLIELMIVVAIIGILSMLSITGYKTVMSKSRMAEGHNVVSGVKIAQDQYFAETGRYANIGWAKICPQDVAANAPKSKPYGWNPGCSGGTSTWASLAYSPDGAIRFGVMTQALPAATVTHPVIPNAANNNTINGALLTDPGTLAKPWYAIAATSDLDGDGDAASYTTIYTTSLNTQIWVDKEGE